MAIFRIDDRIVDTEKAKRSWDEATEWNGHNHISKATGQEFLHQTLYLSGKDRYYLVHSSQWQGSRDSVEFIGRGPGGGVVAGEWARVAGGFGEVWGGDYGVILHR